MIPVKHILRKFLIICLLVSVNYNLCAQLDSCNLTVPPFQANGVEVTHTLGTNLQVINDWSPYQMCSNPNTTVSNIIPQVWLGVWDSLSFWNPFTYTLHFSKAISSMQFIIYGSGTGMSSIDYGAENFIFETEQANLTLQNIYACNEFIDDDTVFLGMNAQGDGLFSISFDCPVYELTISGKGGGSGSNFKICANSITTPELWGRISGDTLVSSAPDSILFEAFGGVAPYEFSFTLNGGGVQTITSNTPKYWLPTPVNDGIYTYELLQVKDGLDSVAVIACHSKHTLEVNLLSIGETNGSADENVKLTLFPNPSKNWLYVSSGNPNLKSANCTILSLDGRTMYSGNINFKDGLSLEHLALASGVYRVTLTVVETQESFNQQFMYWKE